MLKNFKIFFDKIAEVFVEKGIKYMKLKDEDIVQLFFDVTTLNRRYSEKNYGRLNPFKGQYRCLFVLDEVGTINQKDLSALLLIRPTSVSEILVKLELKELIKRTTSEKDNRVSMISLTEKGTEEVKKIRKERAITHSEMLSDLTDDEKSALFIALQKIKNYYTTKETDRIHE